MLDLSGYPVIDKGLLVGTCVRLPIRVDTERLRAEVDSLPASLWGTTGGRVGVHRVADAVFLRGHAPAEGDLPIEDRPALALLPYARSLMEAALGGSPLRCLLARLPAGATIAPHVDKAPYFRKALRVHIPVATHEQAWMVCGGLAFRMAPGEAWVLNNCAQHAVWNAHPSLPRTHMICDFLPTSRLLDLLVRGDRDLGQDVPEVSAYLAGLGLAGPAVRG